MLESTTICNYHSKLSEIDVKIPAFSLFIEELQDDSTYTIQFKMLGSEEHIIDELIKIESENQENFIYAIDKWTANDAGCIAKTVILTYVDINKPDAICPAIPNSRRLLRKSIQQKDTVLSLNRNCTVSFA